MDELKRKVVQVRNRLTLFRVFDWWFIGVITGLSLVALMLLTGKFFPLEFDISLVSAGIIGLCLAAATAGAILKRESLFQAALRTDASLNLRERISSALALAEIHDPEDEACLALENDAIRFARGIQPTKDFRYKPPAYAKHAAWPAIAIIAIYFVPEMNLFSDPPQQTITKPSVTEMSPEQRERQARQLEEIAKQAKKKEVEYNQFGENLDLANRLERLSKDITLGKKNEKEAVAEMSQIRDEMRLEQEKIQQKTEPFRQLSGLRNANQTRDLQKDLKNQDFQAAAEKMQEMAEQIQNMSQEQKEELAQELEDMANQMQQNQQMSQALNQAAQAMKQAAQQQQQQQQQQQNGQSGQQQQQQQQQQAQNQGQQNQQPGQSQNQQQQQQQAANQSGGQQQQQQQAQSQGQQGQSQQQAAAAMQQAAQSMQQMQQMMQQQQTLSEMQNSLGQCMSQSLAQGQGQSEKKQGSGQGQNPNGQQQGGQQAGMAQGQSQSQGQGRGQGANTQSPWSEGTSEAESLGSGGPGRGRAGRPPDDGSMATGFVDTFIPGQKNEGDIIAVFEVDAMVPKGESNISYSTVPGELRQNAADTIRNQEIPVGYRNAVRDYFQNINFNDQ